MAAALDSIVDGKCLERIVLRPFGFARGYGRQVFRRACIRCRREGVFNIVGIPLIRIEQRRIVAPGFRQSDDSRPRLPSHSRYASVVEGDMELQNVRLSRRL